MCGWQLLSTHVATPCRWCPCCVAGWFTHLLVASCFLSIHNTNTHAHRLRFDPTTGFIKDQWTWRGATADEAAWLLSRSHKAFDYDSFVLGTDHRSSSDSSSSSLSSSPSSSPRSSPMASRDGAESAAARAKDAALAFKESFGAVPGADVASLSAALAEDYACKVREREGRGSSIHKRLARNEGDDTACSCSGAKSSSRRRHDPSCLLGLGIMQQQQRKQ